VWGRWYDLVSVRGNVVGINWCPVGTGGIVSRIKGRWWSPRRMRCVVVVREKMRKMVEVGRVLVVQD